MIDENKNNNQNNNIDTNSTQNNNIENKKTIPWQRLNTMRPTITLTPTRSRDRESSSLFFRFLAFLFSPLGVTIIFIMVNYPWLKQYFGHGQQQQGAAASTLSNNGPATPPRFIPKKNKSRVKPQRRNNKDEPPPSPPKLAASASPPKDIKTGASPLELSSECQNLFHRLLDRKCRLQVRQQQHASQTSSNKVPPAKNMNYPANASLAASSSSSSNHNIEPFANNDLECHNLLSRECRQKKRLLALKKKCVAAAACAG